MSDLFCGQELRAAYPFTRTTYDDYEGIDTVGLPEQKPTWRPGVEHDQDNYGNTTTYADAMGEVIYTVIAVFKPGSFPARVFFVRKWQDPDGKVSGKGKLHIPTQQNFRLLTKGYRHDFEMSEGDDNVA